MSSSSQVVESWIASFCALLGHEYFAEVSEDFIEDDFNLTGLSSQVPMYKEALEMILDVEPEEDGSEDEEEDDEISDDDLGANGEPNPSFRNKRHMRMYHDHTVIESSAELLYGLIHQRYINSRQGMSQMQEKYERGHFGACPRVNCTGAKVVPVGCSDTPGQDTVKLFCPSCFDIYTPPNSRFHSVDGAFFGTTFPCLFFMTFPDIQVTAPPEAQQPQQLHHQNDVMTSPFSPRDSLTSPSSTTNQPLSPSPGKSRSSASPPPSEINGVAATNFAPGLGSGRIYEPRIYGFRVSERAKTGPRMKWLRMKPDDLRELDEAKKFATSAAARAARARGQDGGADAQDMEEDEEEEQDGGMDEEMADLVQAEADPLVGRRKKAPMRRRRRIDSTGSGVVGANGVNGVG